MGEEFDEAKAEIEKLRADLKLKTELADNLRKAHGEQLIRTQEACSKIEKLARELNGKEEEISKAKGMCEDFQSSLHEKESVIRRLSTANDKLRVDSGEKYKKWEEEKRGLVLALDEANEKNIDQEQKINVFMAEIEGLKGLLSASQKKCLEAEKNAKASKEMRKRDAMLLKLEEESRKVENQLKWKKEQFSHLEEAHEKLRDQFKESKKGWEMEKSTLIDEICSLQSRLDSQTRILEDLERRFKMCNEALAHEESRRKHLEVEVSEYKARFENVFTECQDAKEIAALRHSLATKETFYKEIEYKARRLEQENQELLVSLKELQEAGIRESGNSSLGKMRNKLKSLEQMHRNCSSDLRAKEAEWSFQMKKLTEELDNYRTALESKETTVEELQMELEICHTVILQLKMQNEEASTTLLVLKSGITEAQLNIENADTEARLREKERGENVSLLMRQLETKTTALNKVASLLKRVEDLDFVEDQRQLLQKELERYKESLEESSRSQLYFKKQALQTETDLKDKLKAVCDDLDVANSELAKEHEKVVYLSRKAKALDLIEAKCLLMQKELEKYKEALEQSSRHQLCLEKQASQIENDSKERFREVCDAFDMASSELAEKVECLFRRVDHLELSLQMQKELEKYKEMLEESSRCQHRLEKQAFQKEKDLKEKLQEVCDALDRLKSDFAAKNHEGHALEFELWMWKTIAHRLKDDLEDSQLLRKDIELLFYHKDSRIDNMQHQIDFLEKELKTRESAASTSAMETVMSLESEKEGFLRTMREKDKILNDLQKEVGWLEQESLRRELEVSVLTLAEAERKFDLDKEHFIQLMEEKDQRIDELLQCVRSREQKFNGSLISLSLELAEKQAEISLVHEAWEKIASAEILAQLEIEEKKMMLTELEDDIFSVQEKLELQEKSLSESKHKALEIEAELEEKLLEMKKLENLMETKLRMSEASIDELRKGNKSLAENVMKLSSERDNMFAFFMGLGERISQFSNEDMQLMGTLACMVQSFDDDSGSSSSMLKSETELSHAVKENVNTCPSPTVKRFQSTLEERAPFRELN
ncbi:bHLH family protein [Salix suchowensis]|nr:bHLH family protein [Salix suchowensis]